MTVVNEIIMDYLDASFKLGDAEDKYIHITIDNLFDQIVNFNTFDWKGVLQHVEERFHGEFFIYLHAVNTPTPPLRLAARGRGRRKPKKIEKEGLCHLVGCDTYGRLTRGLCIRHYRQLRSNER